MFINTYTPQTLEPSLVNTDKIHSITLKDVNGSYNEWFDDGDTLIDCFIHTDRTGFTVSINIPTLLELGFAIEDIPTIDRRV